MPCGFIFIVKDDKLKVSLDITLNTTEGLGETKQRFYQTEDEDDSSYKTNPLPSPGSWWLSCFNFILWGTLAELEGRIGRPLEDETESCWLVLFVPVHSAVCV